MNNFNIQKVSIMLLEFFHDEEITEETDLLTTNKLDSINVIDLTLFIEDKFGLEIYMEEITRENFGSIANIVNFLQYKSKSGTKP